MQKGDISSEVSPRFVWIWEGLVATLPENRRAKEWAYRKAHMLTRAVNQWEINPRIKAVIWDLAWRHRYGNDIVTFLPMEEAIAQKLGDIPATVKWFPDAAALSRQLSYMPHIQRVFFAEPSLSLAFGSVGRAVVDGGMNFSPFL